MFNNTKGIVAPVLLVVLAAAGMIAYFLVSSSVPFKDELLSRLYPKPPVKAEGNIFPCGRPNQIQIGQENPGYTCLPQNGCTKTPYARYQYTSDENGDGVADPANPYDQPWCDNNCADPVKYCDEGGSSPPPSGSACSGDACTDCILNTITDILPFYSANGWTGITDCSNPPNTNQVAVVDNWCGIDPDGCYTVQSTTCASVCGYATPAPSLVPSCPYSGDNCVYSASDGKCYSGVTSDLSTCTAGYDKCFNPSAGCKYSCGPTACPNYTGGTGGNPTPTPTPTSTNSFNLEYNCNNGPGLSASWVGGTGDKCNAHVYAGSTGYKVSSQCSGTWTGNTLPGGPTIVTGGTYKLCLNNPGGNQLGCSREVTPSCEESSDPCPGKHQKDPPYACDPACCAQDFQCPSGQTCSIGNGGCQSGFSCNPDTAPSPSSSTGCTNPTGAEGSWRYVCTIKTCPIDPNQGVGVPYQCQSGQWVVTNKSGECTNQCKLSGGTTCQTQNCSITRQNTSCPSGQEVCSGTGNSNSCTYVEGCSACQCIDAPVPQNKKDACYPPSLLNKNPLKTNYGDPDCNFTKYGLFDVVKKYDPGRENIWMCMAYEESTYYPNAYCNQVACSSFWPKAGVWGLFQMGACNSKENDSNDGCNYDRGDVVWDKQAYNAIMYSRTKLNGGLSYWPAASRICSGNNYSWPR